MSERAGKYPKGAQGSPEAFEGSYGIYQEPAFAALFAGHYRLRVLDLGGLLVLVRENPLLGYTRGLVGSPELSGPVGEWSAKVQSLPCGSLEIHTGVPAELPSWHRVSPADNVSMLVDLSVGAASLFASFGRGCQRAIAAGLKSGVTIGEGQDTRDMKALYQICLRISGGATLFALPPYPLVEELFRSPHAKLIVALYRGKVIGGVLFLLTRSRQMHGWIGGIDREFVPLSPGNLMHFEAMQWGMAQRYRYYDFGEQSLSAKPGLTSFKMSFHPLLKPAYVYRVRTSRTRGLLTDFRGYLSRS